MGMLIHKYRICMYMVLYHLNLSPVSTIVGKQGERGETKISAGQTKL